MTTNQQMQEQEPEAVDQETCDWRFISRQFVPNVDENLGGFQSHLNIDSRKLSQL